ncbi:CDP-diacylglycerol diphosphatase [Serratia fonticola]|uniref:CDP-diacylglycerol pyrophosphatase n=1 Tax=Serratia fonticola TaxID=47917 RepID=A0AAW3WWX7_SERFO|nr:CDP-diacylglycerol diphosphatase [Serratia fonticola]MBC3214097.1 CDP-diacylglycerol diphosphatase [Serratia fonticola]NYA14921.1 CDP-diacylglycerol diphosphatase [Serratia fonticola]NYA34758.1 CDP-diacylglycerol diphosphatase [Serratia fonticola]RDL22695.1 CDP-diacylglycerol pyrophosphatase [Serratia fonticola]
MSLRRWLCLSVTLLIIIAIATYFWLKPAHPDALWHIVSQQCLPNQQQNHNPAPCTQVDEQAGFVVLKDRNGPLQYLLMPTAKITGIESPLVLEPDTANLFTLAWQARHFMADKLGKPIDDAAISLAINSEYGRTQNQLHIHISCLQPAVKNRLAQLQGDFSESWQPLPGGLLGHDYLARRASAAELKQLGAFRLLAQGVEGARESMGSYGMAMTALPGGDFLLLAVKRNLWQLNLASAEEIQDHSCQVLQ